MSDSDETLVASATALVDTYQAIDAPTLDDLNTLTSGIALLLNRSEITSDETAQIITILSSLLDTVTTISGSDADYSFMGIELSQLTPVMNVKFLNCVNSILMDPSVDWLGYWSKVSPLISPYLSSTSTISKAEYSALWTSISNVLSDYLEATYISEMEKRFNAILTMYFNLNYSNLMTKTLSEATILGFLVANLQVSLLTTYGLTSNVSELFSNVNVFFTDNGLDTSGMNASEFITACKDTLAYLSLYLTSTQISAIKTSMETFISESFFTSTTCESKVMALSSASTLTTSLTSSFGVGAIPLTPTASASLIDGLPMVILMYPFTSDAYSAINSAVSTYLAGTSYTTLGLTATQVGKIWGVIQSTATPKMTMIGDVSVSDFSIMMQTAFNNLLSVILNDNINYVLSSTGFYDSALQDLILT